MQTLLYTAIDDPLIVFKIDTFRPRLMTQR
jgi:hypothetical protein